VVQGITSPTRGVPVFARALPGSGDLRVLKGARAPVPPELSWANRHWGRAIWPAKTFATFRAGLCRASFFCVRAARSSDRRVLSGTRVPVPPEFIVGELPLGTIDLVCQDFDALPGGALPRRPHAVRSNTLCARTRRTLGRTARSKRAVRSDTLFARARQTLGRAVRSDAPRALTRRRLGEIWNGLEPPPLLLAPAVAPKS